MKATAQRLLRLNEVKPLLHCWIISAFEEPGTLSWKIGNLDGNTSSESLRFHENPRKPLEHDLFEQEAVVVLGPAPFGLMIVLVEGIARAPPTARSAVGADLDSRIGFQLGIPSTDVRLIQKLRSQANAIMYPVAMPGFHEHRLCAIDSFQSLFGLAQLVQNEGGVDVAIGDFV